MMDNQNVGYQTQNADNQQTPTVSTQSVNAAYPQSYSRPHAAYPQVAPGQQPYAQPPYQQPHYMPVVMVPGYMPVPRQSNGTGTAGFVLALLGLLFSWIPVLDIILWLLGLILSFAGLFSRPKGLAIAGTVLSLLGAIVIIFLIGSLGLFAFLR